MFYTSEATEKPSKVVLESLPDGRKRVLLNDNVKEVTRYEGLDEEGKERISTAFQYETVEFYLPEDRQEETVETITGDFASWWEFGKTPAVSVTLEERVAALEELALA